MVYKKHEITTVYVAERGHFWIIDGNVKAGYQSGKDAKAVVSGRRPRWKAVDLTSLFNE